MSTARAVWASAKLNAVVKHCLKWLSQSFAQLLVNYADQHHLFAQRRDGLLCSK